MRQPRRPLFEVRELGTVEYREAWDLQRTLVEERASDRIPDTLLLLEHTPVVTCGRGLRERSLLATSHPVFHVERGGDVTYHGPGQLMGYPIVHLRQRGLTVRAWLRLIEERLIDALSDFGLRGERLRGFTGVWCAGRKLASIGIAVRSWVSFHGFALNVTADPAQATGLYPCGLEPGQFACMAELLGRPIDPAEARASAARSFREALAAPASGNA